jgi:MtN3 and saliva related transmembrane protein
MAAGFVSTVAFLPQALKVWRTRSTRGISTGMYALYCLSLVLWGIYAWMIEAWPLLVTEIVTGLMTFYILVMTLRGFDD